MMIHNVAKCRRGDFFIVPLYHPSIVGENDGTKNYADLLRVRPNVQFLISWGASISGPQK